MKLDFKKMEKDEDFLAKLREHDTVVFILYDDYLISGVIDWEQGAGDNYFVRTHKGEDVRISEVTHYAIPKRMYRVTLVLKEDKETFTHVETGETEEDAVKKALKASEVMVNAKASNVVVKVERENLLRNKFEPLIVSKLSHYNPSVFEI